MEEEGCKVRGAVANVGREHVRKLHRNGQPPRTGVRDAGGSTLVLPRGRCGVEVPAPRSTTIESSVHIAFSSKIFTLEESRAR